MLLCFTKKSKQIKLNNLLRSKNITFEDGKVPLSRIHPLYSIEKKFPNKLKSQTNLILDIYDKLKYTYNQPITKKILYSLFGCNQPIKLVYLYDEDRFLIVDGNFRVITLFKLYNLLNKRLPSIECQVAQIQNKELSDKIKKIVPSYQICK